MKSRNRAWRRRQARRVLAKISETKAWLLNTVQKRNGEKPMPVPDLKVHEHGKLTAVQEKRLQHKLKAQLADAWFRDSSIPDANAA